MIKYQQVKARELTGTYDGEVVAVELEDNQYYNPDNANSTDKVMSITFQLQDRLEGAAADIMFTQKFVSPLIGGKGLFQQLVDISNLETSEDGGEIDENTFVGLKVSVTFGKNKKGFDTVDYVTGRPERNDKVDTSSEDLPEFLKS